MERCWETGLTGSQQTCWLLWAELEGFVVEAAGGLAWGGFNMPNTAAHPWGSALRRKYRAPAGEHMSLCCFCICCPRLSWSEAMHFSWGGRGWQNTHVPCPSLHNQRAAASVASPPFPHCPRQSVCPTALLPFLSSHIIPIWLLAAWQCPFHGDSADLGQLFSSLLLLGLCQCLSVLSLVLLRN